MPFKNAEEQRKYNREYQREYMPMWRLANPETAKKINQAYEQSKRGKLSRAEYEKSKRKRPEGFLEERRPKERIRSRERMLDPEFREARRLKSLDYRRRNPEKSRASVARWRKKNPQACKINDQKRRKSPKRIAWKKRTAAHYANIRRVRKLEVSTKEKKSIKKIYARAAELRQWFNVCVDHIIPIAKGGLHRRGNLQIIYKYENQIKHARLDYIPSVIFA